MSPVQIVTASDIIQGGGLVQLGINLSGGMNRNDALARLERNYPGVSVNTQNALLELADRGVIAGDYLTQTLNGHLMQDEPFDISNLPMLADDFASEIHQPRNLLGQFSKNDTVLDRLRTPFPFESIPTVSGVLGDNEESARSMVIGEGFDAENDTNLLMYLTLNGTEEWLDVANKFLVWQLYFAQQYQYKGIQKVQRLLSEVNIRIAFNEW